MSVHESRVRLLTSGPLPCAKAPDLYFGPEDETSAEQRTRERAARAVCDTCAVSALCLEVALTEQPEYGIWAGHPAGEIRHYFPTTDQAA